MNWKAFLPTLICCCGLVLSTMVDAEDAHHVLSAVTSPGNFRVSMESSLTPLQINTMHTWVIHISDSGGAPVGDAQISVTGGMPLHDHGLPTQPMVTRYLGEGRYLLEGMRFHMHGEWDLRLEFLTGTNRESVLFTLAL